MSTKIKRFSFIVTFDNPGTGMTLRDARSFVREAVQMWGGQTFPGDEDNAPDPRFELYVRKHSIRVRDGQHIRTKVHTS